MKGGKQFIAVLFIGILLLSGSAVVSADHYDLHSILPRIGMFLAHLKTNVATLFDEVNNLQLGLEGTNNNVETLQNEMAATQAQLNETVEQVMLLQTAVIEAQANILVLEGEIEAIQEELNDISELLPEYTATFYHLLDDSQTGQATGWDPAGCCIDLTIENEDVSAFSAIILSVDTNNVQEEEDPHACSVKDLEEEESFTITCETDVPDGSILNYVLLNPLD